MKPSFTPICILLLSCAILFSAFHNADMAHPASVYDPAQRQAEAFTPVNADTAGAMISAYAQLPLPIVSSGGQVKGFQIDPKDFASIKSKIAGYQTLMLYLGVQNYKPAVAKEQGPLYTLVVVPMKTDGTADQSNMFEYVQPCPPICPPNPPGGGNH